MFTHHQTVAHLENKETKCLQLISEKQRLQFQLDGVAAKVKSISNYSLGLFDCLIGVFLLSPQLEHTAHVALFATTVIPTCACAR